MDQRSDQEDALFVSLNHPNKRLKINGVEIRLRELGRKLGIKKIHPHKFRRTMATRAIDKGMPIEQVQQILGHQQIDTTIQYAMVNQKKVIANRVKQDQYELGKIKVKTPGGNLVFCYSSERTLFLCRISMK